VRQKIKYCWHEVRLDGAVPTLRRLVAGLTPRRPGFDSRSIHVRFVLVKVALGQVSVRVVVYPVGMLSPVFYTYLYRHDTLSSPRNLSNRNVLLEMGEHWKEKYFLGAAKG
jgi:hypothetical protein